MSLAFSVIINVELPSSLCRLAGIGGRLAVRLHGPATQRALLDALETAHPALRGTIREHETKCRRPYIRFFGGQEDLSRMAPDDPLPFAIANGMEPFLIIGAIAGG